MTEKYVIYEYRFVRVKLGGPTTPVEDYRKIVEEHAKRGWRLVQVLILPVFDGYSMAQQLELILERSAP